MIQETKLTRKNRIRLKNYEIFERVRKNKTGGGVMIGIRKDIHPPPVDVSPQDEDVEILTIEVQLKKLTVRFLTGYGPQEDDSDDKINKFYCALEEAIVSCEERNCGIIIELDCNAKLGKDIIRGDPHDISRNGKLLWEMIQRRSCTVVNSSEKCKGVITRSRMKSGKKEESVIDFVIVNSLMKPYIEEMEIDESKMMALTRFKKGIPVPSDHNFLSCSFNIPVNKQASSRQEVYCLRNKADLKIFKEKTSKTNRFTNCFTREGDIKKEGRKWMKTLQNTIHKCFKKVRIVQKKKCHIQEQLDVRRKLQSDIKHAQTAEERHKLEDILQKVEDKISEDCETKQYEKITSQLQSITNDNGTTNTTGVWRLRQKMFPKPTEHLTAKRDKEGNLVTNPEALKEIYIDGYVERLQHRKIIPELLQLKTLREELFHQRLALSRENKSPKWTMDDLDQVLRHLKERKATDPTGLVNELFTINNIGEDLKNSILILMNKIKENFQDPKFISMANITSLWKRKGAKDDIDNERGIFILNVLRMIKDRLIHNDIKKVVEMSDSQVGARSEFSIRNHLFIIYSCLNSANQNESPPLDLHMYDLTKCFDGLWLEECCNNLFEAGVTDDKLALIYEGNRINQVAVKTPGGLTERKIIERVVTQGGVTGPVCCAVQTDKLGKDALNSNEYLYMYKGKVGIPTLAMVDDIAKISICGTPAVIDNAYINARIEQSKQSFNGTKCHSIHAGKQRRPCDTLSAHNTEMEVVDKEKYVGDIITGDGKHTKNITARRSKGLGIISEIVTILDGLCLGPHYFTTALMMRQCMLLAVLLFNSETWLRLTKKDMDKIEGIDRMFLRRIFHVPNSVPTPFLYLETGCIPLNYIMKMKRVMFLHHILTREDNALIKRFFWAQVQQPVKGDWCLIVREDLESIGLPELSFEKIERMGKEALRTLLKNKVRETALSDLIAEKRKRSKLSGLDYSTLECQPYLLPQSNLTNKMKRALFRWRSHTINVLQNIGKKDALCPLCEKAADTQYHLLTCPELAIPQPWNIESVINALRKREVILEQRKEKSDKSNRRTSKVKKQKRKKTN